MTTLLRPSDFARCLVVLLLACSIAQAQEQSVRPGINRHYENPNWQQWVDRFERKGREIYDERHAIVAASAVLPGMTVADIGAGTGLFTRLFATAVTPTGRVYAVDIAKTFIDNILRTCREQNLANVQGIVNTQKSVGLPVNSVDLAFITATYHHFEHPQRMLASIHSALHTDGRLIIIDFRRDPEISKPWVMKHVRGNKEQVLREVQAAGFQLVDDKPLLRKNYFLEFKRK